MKHSVRFLKAHIARKEAELAGIASALAIAREKLKEGETETALRLPKVKRPKTLAPPKIKRPNLLKKERVLESNRPSELAAILGISRQRAFQLLHPERIRAAHIFRYALESGKILKPSACEICGRGTEELEAHHPDYQKPLEVVWSCQGCHNGTHVESRNKHSTCEICGKAFYKTPREIRRGLKRFCSLACKIEARRRGILKMNSKAPLVSRVCETCGATFTRLVYNIRLKSPGRFCSRRCLSKWLASQFGMGSPRETMRQREARDLSIARFSQQAKEMSHLGGLAKTQKVLGATPAPCVPGGASPSGGMSPRPRPAEGGPLPTPRLVVDGSAGRA